MFFVVTVNYGLKLLMSPSSSDFVEKSVGNILIILVERVEGSRINQRDFSSRNCEFDPTTFSKHKS